MSRLPTELPTERLAVALMPAQVGVLHAPAGWRRTEPKQFVLEVAAGMAEMPAWQAALDQFEIWLAKQRLRRAEASLVLSNRFVRFALAPWSASLSGPDEEMELARACLESSYGDMAGWTVQLDAGGYGESRMVCAVETALIDAARQLFDRKRLKCGVVAPAFVAGWNHFRRELGREFGATKDRGKAIFAMAESATLLVATQRAGRMYSLRAMAMGDDVTAIPNLLVREAVLQGFAAMPPAWITLPGSAGSAMESIPASPLHIFGAGGSLAAALEIAAWVAKA